MVPFSCTKPGKCSNGPVWSPIIGFHSNSTIFTYIYSSGYDLGLSGWVNSMLHQSDHAAMAPDSKSKSGTTDPSVNLVSQIASHWHLMLTFNVYIWFIFHFYPSRMGGVTLVTWDQAAMNFSHAGGDQLFHASC